MSFERESSSIWIRNNCFLPHRLSSASDWLPGYEHRVLAPVLWPIRSQNSSHSTLRNSCWCGPRQCRAVPDLHPPIGMLYLVLITSLRIHKAKIYVRNLNRRQFPLKRQNLTALFSSPRCTSFGRVKKNWVNFPLFSPPPPSGKEKRNDMGPLALNRLLL